jgi:hypothetical protein
MNAVKVSILAKTKTVLVRGTIKYDDVTVLMSA